MRNSILLFLALHGLGPFPILGRLTARNALKGEVRGDKKARRELQGIEDLFFPFKKSRSSDEESDDEALFDFPTFGEERDVTREDFVSRLETLQEFATEAGDQEVPFLFPSMEDFIGLVEGVIQNAAPCGLEPDTIVKAVQGALYNVIPTCNGLSPLKPPEEPLVWSLNFAGMVTASYALIFASPVEYILVFGSPIPTHGFSGRYQDFNVSDTIIQGEHYLYTPGEYTATFTPCGETTVLLSGNAAAYSIAADGPTWMIEYGRGDILSVLDYGVTFPTYFTTLDFDSALTILDDQLALNLRFATWGACLAQQQQNPPPEP